MKRKLQSVGLILLMLMASMNTGWSWTVNPAKTIIVIPDSTFDGVEFAAQELQSYVAKSTGVKMPILQEGKVPTASPQRLYLGAAKAAYQAGIDGTMIPRDAYHIRTAGEVVYLVGGDGPGDPKDTRLRTPVGTLFAVYDVIDNDLGVRWLWPGESGEYVPKHDTLQIKHRDVTVLPRFRFCGLRTERGIEAEWMRRMRMHWTDGMSFGHAFETWDDKYFAEHPGWFEMDKQGVRQKNKSMCVSNPGFHKQIVENWWEQRQKHPKDKGVLNICENDGPGACCCPSCLAWDGPEAPWPKPTPYDNVHNVSQRYARFNMEVLKLAQKYDPDVEALGYAYSNIVFEPSGVVLHKSVIMGYVPDVYFPRTPEQHEWVHRQYLGWVKAGASMFLRPNYLLHGYCMPVNWTRQLSEDFKIFEQNGMIGTDYDSLTGMWSTMGLSLYVLGRLHVNPEMPLEEILNEYYSAFGPASKQVQAYWEYWERYLVEHMDAHRDGLWCYVRYPENIEKRFPLESFDPADKIMEEAVQAAKDDPGASVKVNFLKTGLIHARLCVEASLAFKAAGEDAGKRKAAMEKLIAFRKTISDPMVVNLRDGDSSCRGREVNLEWPVE